MQALAWSLNRSFSIPWGLLVLAAPIAVSLHRWVVDPVRKERLAELKKKNDELAVQIRKVRFERSQIQNEIFDRVEKEVQDQVAKNSARLADKYAKIRADLDEREEAVAKREKNVQQWQNEAHNASQKLAHEREVVNTLWQVIHGARAALEAGNTGMAIRKLTREKHHIKKRSERSKRRSA